MIMKEDLRFLLSLTLDPLAPFTNKLATIDKPSSCHIDRRKSKIGDGGRIMAVLTDKV
jgi:hypothetical protein